MNGLFGSMILGRQNKGPWSRENTCESSFKHMLLNWPPQGNIVCLIPESSKISGGFQNHPDQK